MFCSSCGANVADGSAFCGACGRPIVGYAAGGAGAGISPVAAVSATPYAGAPGTVATHGGAYAGFWIRVGASFIDSLVLAIPTVVVMLLAFASVLPALVQMGRSANFMLIVGVFLPRLLFVMIVLLAGTWLYCSVMESSSWQATVGKKALGLYVTDIDGRRVSFGKASGRFLAGRGIGTLVHLYYLVDCVLVAFTEKKQALHDIIAGTLVMRRSQS
jgi:uncharacterized RDD family membrane protein YckC